MDLGRFFRRLTLFACYHTMIATIVFFCSFFNLRVPIAFIAGYDNSIVFVYDIAGVILYSEAIVRYSMG